MADRIPHPANAPGDFYVEDSCCTMCGVPFVEAPDLFGEVQDERGYAHCYIKRQPETPAEVDQVISTIRCAELRCIRYRGADRVVQLRLVDADEGAVCDGLPADLQAQADRREAALQAGRLEAESDLRELERRRWLRPGDGHPATPAQPNRSRPWWRFW